MMAMVMVMMDNDGDLVTVVVMMLVMIMDLYLIMGCEDGQVMLMVTVKEVKMIVAVSLIMI